MQKDVKPDLAQLNRLAMMNGHAGAGAGMSSYLQNMTNMAAHMNGDLSHVGGGGGGGNTHAHAHSPPMGGSHHAHAQMGVGVSVSHAHMNGAMTLNTNSGALSLSPPQHSNGLGGGGAGGGPGPFGSHTHHHHPQPVPDPFVMVPLSQGLADTLEASAGGGGGGAMSSPPPPLSASPHHSSNSSTGGHTPTRVLMSPTSTQLSPLPGPGVGLNPGAATGTIVVQPKLEPLDWGKQTSCSGGARLSPRYRVPQPRDDDMKWIQQVSASKATAFRSRPNHT